MRKKETPNPSRVRGRGVEVSETLFYFTKDLRYSWILPGTTYSAFFLQGIVIIVI